MGRNFSRQAEIPGNDIIENQGNNSFVISFELFLELC